MTKQEKQVLYNLEDITIYNLEDITQAPIDAVYM